jgi:hypothetical protein
MSIDAARGRHKPSRRMHHVAVRNGVQRHLQAMKQPSRFHDRNVERLAVVGDDEISLFEELGDGPQQRSLGRMTGEQKLPHLKRPEVEEPATHQERDGPRSSAEARRLEIDEHGPRKRT